MDKKAPTINVVKRALDLLEALVAGNSDTSLTQLSKSTGLALSTTHRILNTLLVSGYLRQDASTGRYVVGARLTDLAERTLAQDRLNLRLIAHPHLKQLVEETGETANFAALQGNEAYYVDQVASRWIVRGAVNEDHRVPLHCSAVGKSLLAFQDDARRERTIGRLVLHKFTPRTLVDVDDLRAELEQVRANGLSVDNEEMELGMRCIAAPVFVDGLAIAAVSVTGPVSRINDDALPGMSDAVQAAARRLSEALAEAS